MAHAMKGKTYRFRIMDLKKGKLTRHKYRDMDKAEMRAVSLVYNQGYKDLEVIDRVRGDRTIMVVTRLGKTISWSGKK